LGKRVTFNYIIKEGNFSPKAISINGNTIVFHFHENKYRPGGAVIAADQFLALLNQQENIVEIHL
jgi:hypothetical protein